MKKRKYIYWRVLQQNGGYGWDDIEHYLLSYPYDLVDCEDLRGLEWHIEHYYNMYKEDEQC